MFERFSRAARAAVVQAQDEARELRAPRIDIEHLLLGVVRAAEGDLRALLDDAGFTLDGLRRELADASAEPLGAEDAEALRSIGIDLDAVRDAIAGTFGPEALYAAGSVDQPRLGRPRPGRHIPFARAAKKTLELSLREAIARQERTLQLEHLLLAICRAPGGTVTALAAERLAADGLRVRVEALLDRAA